MHGKGRTAVDLTRGFLLTVGIAVACLPALPASPDPPLDLYQLVDETVMQAQVGDRVAMAWWIPEEFWAAAFAEEGITQANLDHLVSVLKPYVVVAALEGRFDRSGELELADVSALRRSLKIRDVRGQEYPPLGADQISPDAMLLALSLKPALVDLLGSVVKDLEFFYFPASSPDGAPVARAAGTGVFSIAVGDALFEWDLPLVSLLPPKRCIVDGRRLNGAWIYCPWHGVRLADD